MHDQRPVTIGGREIGDAAEVYIVFEAGPTHSGVESAKALATAAATAGAHAIKFQILDVDRLVADRNQLFAYEILLDRETGATRKVEEPLYDILKRRSLEKDQWRAVKAHCDTLGLAFFATAGFPDEVELLAELQCHSIKIASADVNHYPLIRQAARTGMCLQIDTGNSSIGEIEMAIDVIRSEGNENIIIHHCPSGYPAHLDGINLRTLTTLRQMFRYPLAFSDHTPGATMDIAAVALGANLVEKTITMDRTTPSIEHIMSIEPHEMAQFVRTISDVKRALGQPRRILHPEERQKRLAIRRSAFVLEPVEAGQPLAQARIEFRRPGFGLAPDEYERLQDATFRKALPAGHMLRVTDVE